MRIADLRSSLLTTSLLRSIASGWLACWLARSRCTVLVRVMEAQGLLSEGVAADSLTLISIVVETSEQGRLALSDAGIHTGE